MAPGKTVRLVTTNLDFVTPEAKDKVHLDHLVKRFVENAPADVEGVVLGAQEARNFRLAGVLKVVGKLLRLVRLAGPTVVQGDGPAQSGTAIAAYGITLHNPRFILSALASHITLARWITRAAVEVHGGRLEVNVVHIVPPRAGRAAQLKQLAKVADLCRRAEKRSHGWSVLADFNLPKDLVATTLGGVYYGTPGGIGIVVSNNVLVYGQGSDTFGERNRDTDHPAWYIDVNGLKAT